MTGMTSLKNLLKNNLLLALIGGFMILTNPTKEEFEEYICCRAELPYFGGALVAKYQTLAKLISTYTQRDNFYFFSVYTMNLRALRISDPENKPVAKYIGIGKAFARFE